MFALLSSPYLSGGIDATFRADPGPHPTAGRHKGARSCENPRRDRFWQSSHGGILSMKHATKAALCAALIVSAGCAGVKSGAKSVERHEFTGRIVRVAEMPTLDTSAFLQQQLGASWTTASLAPTPSPMARGYTIYRVRSTDGRERAIATWDNGFRVDECVVVVHRSTHRGPDFSVGEAELGPSSECTKGA